MNAQRFSRLFPFGSHLCREPMPPMCELKRDVETLRAHGFNLIKLQEHWMIDEPAEEVYDFSRYEELIEHAAKLDLGVYLGLTCEQAPAWLYRKYPDCRMVGRDGRVLVYEAPTTLPADGKPGPCFDHPGVRDDQARFLSRLVKALGRFENVVLWNTWQEIGYWTEGLLGTSVCYCPYTLAHFRRWLLTALASGVTAICFWVTRAEIMAAEMNGFSLLDSVGESTPRLEEAARIGQALNRHADLFARPSTPPAAVGLLINEDNFLFCRTLSPGGEHLGYSLAGWYRLLWEEGIPVDFVSLSEPEEAPLEQYRALVLPFPLCLSEQAAARLAAYVEAGGHLICEAAPGRVNEQAFCNRGELSPTMAALFGIRQEDFTMVREPHGGARWSPRERTSGEYFDPVILAGTGPLAGHTLQAMVCLETFVAEVGEPCLLAGEAVAGVMRRLGEGQAWLLGTCAGHGAVAYRDAASRQCLLTILAHCGVTPVHSGRLLLRKRAIPGKEAWLLTNPTAEEITESLSVADWAQVEGLLGEPLAREGDRVTVTVGPLEVRVLVLSQE